MRHLFQKTPISPIMFFHEKNPNLECLISNQFYDRKHNISTIRRFDKFHIGSRFFEDLFPHLYTYKLHLLIRRYAKKLLGYKIKVVIAAFTLLLNEYITNKEHLSYSSIQWLLIINRSRCSQFTCHFLKYFPNKSTITLIYFEIIKTLKRNLEKEQLKLKQMSASSQYIIIWSFCCWILDFFSRFIINLIVNFQLRKHKSHNKFLVANVWKVVCKFVLKNIDENLNIKFG